MMKKNLALDPNDTKWVVQGSEAFIPQGFQGPPCATSRTFSCYSVTLVMAPFSAPCTNLANFANTPDV
jgi:hypothetical protein